MATGTTSFVLALARAGDTARGLEMIGEALEVHPDCPYLLVLQAVLIQAQRTEGPLGLKDAERSLLRAYEIDAGYLPAIEELAHYYDAVEPDQERPRAYARQYIDKTSEPLLRMRQILE